MKSMSTVGRVLLVSALTLGMASSTSAQDIKAEVSGGYQLLGLKSGADETLGKGWYADVSGNLGRFFSVVGQVSGNYKTFEETETFLGVTSSVKADFKLHSFMGGVRTTAHPNATVAPYGEFLVGGVNGSFTFSGSVTGDGTTFFSSSSSDSSTKLGVQAGGGVTIWLRETFGVRGSAGYIAVFSDGDHLNAFRVAAGAVFGL